MIRAVSVATATLAVTLMLTSCASKSSDAGGGTKAAGGAPDTARRLVVENNPASISSTPSCTWPMHVKGDIDGKVSGLLACYLKAEFDENLHELARLVRADTPVTLTRADLRYGRYLQRGTATVKVTPNPFDDAAKNITIIYPAGPSVDVGVSQENSRNSNSWRLDLG